MCSRNWLGETRKLSTERARTNRIVGRLASVLLALLVVAGSGLAQVRRGRGGGGPQGPPRGERRMGPIARPDRDFHRHEPGFLRRLRDLPPEQQERVLRNDERFQRLPPERQQMIRERLRQWSALSPEERQRIRERQEIFMNLSPEQRREARALFPRWQQLEPERRQEVMRAFRQMRDLPPKERPQFLSRPDVQKRFHPEERRLLEGLGRLLPGAEIDSMDEAED